MFHQGAKNMVDVSALFMGYVTDTKKSSIELQELHAFHHSTAHFVWDQQGSLNYQFWGNQTIEIYGKFEGFSLL